MEFRNATLEERKSFYENEFDAEKLESMNFKPQLFCVDPGSKTGISKFPDKNGKLMMLPPHLTPELLKRKLIFLLPEGAYYDRNIYTDIDAFFAGKQFDEFWKDKNYAGQELCFDVDAENIREVDHNHKANYTSIIKEAGEQALKVAESLRKNQGFSKISFVYSGRGFHVKVNDPGTEKLSFKERTQINDTLNKFPIDRWVSGGHSKLMRLPFSLHGIVSRIVTPLKESELEDFDPNQDKIIPDFLKK